MNFIRSTFRCLVNYAPILTIVFVYAKIALLLTSYSVVWVQPEEFNWRESILKGGTSLTAHDVRGAFNWELFEYVPRSTRPLSSYLEIVDTKLRVLLWRVIPPHPSLSLTWIPLLVVSPWLFYKLLRNLGISNATAALTTALYLGNPATLSLLAVDFRPAKALANCAIVACLYWASRIQKSRAEKTADRPRSAALLWIFMFGSFFLDETALLSYPAVVLFFPSVAFGRRSDAIITGFLPIATFVAWFYWIPRLTVLAGWPRPTLGQFDPVSSWMGMAAIRNVFQPRWFGDWAINLKIFLSDTFGLVDPRLAATASYFALWLAVIVCLALITWRCVAVVRREGLGGGAHSQRDAHRPVTLKRAVVGLIAASFCANLLLHSVENRLWGLHWLNTYWPIFFLIVVALVLDRADINALFVSVTVCLVVTASILNFTYVNNAFKQFFYYRTVNFDMVLINRLNRFQIPRGNDSRMLNKTLEIWKTHRMSERIGEIPTELYYLVHDLRLSKPGYQVNQQWSVFDGHVLEFELVREGGVEPRYMEAIPSKRTGQ